MDRLTTADFNVAVCIDSPPGSSKSVTREQKICARLWRLQKNPGELQKSHKMDLRVSNFGVVEGQRPNLPAHLLSSTLWAITPLPNATQRTRRTLSISKCRRRCSPAPTR